MRVEVVASNFLLVDVGLLGTAKLVAVTHNFAQQVHVGRIKLDSPPQVHKGFVGTPCLCVNTTNATQGLASLLKLVAAQVDVGQDAEFGDAFVDHTAIDVDITKLSMRTGILRCHLYHFVEYAQGAVGLTFAAIVLDQIRVLIHSAAYITTSG